MSTHPAHTVGSWLQVGGDKSDDFVGVSGILETLAFDVGQEAGYTPDWLPVNHGARIDKQPFRLMYNLFN